jgi:hypothetical protein
MFLNFGDPAASTQCGVAKAAAIARTTVATKK